MAGKSLPIFERRRPSDGALLGYQVKIRKKGWPAVSQQFDRLADAQTFAIATLDRMNAGTYIDRAVTPKAHPVEAGVRG